MEQPRCPRCRGHAVRRCPRSGPIERALGLAYVYPFRCQLCSRRFRALRWGARYSRQSVDRREYERVPVRLPVTLWTGDERAEGETLDLSLGGCAVRAPAAPPPGTPVRLAVHLPAGGPPVEVEGVVRASRPGALSVHFVRLVGDHRQRLRHVVGSLLRPDGIDRPPRRRESAGFWLAALVVIFVFLALIALMPSVSRCIAGVSC